MSIKLRFEKGSLVTQVALADEALPVLLDLIAKHQVDEPSVATPSLLSHFFSEAKSPKSGQSSVKEWLSDHTPSEVLNKIGWETYPEKILLLGALHESKTNA